LNRDVMKKYHAAENQYERACMEDIRMHTRKSVNPDWSVLWTRSRRGMTAPARAVDNLRSRLRVLMKTARRGGADVKCLYIGCSTSQLSRHLESRFTKQMTWENYGTYWHVDHILPCASFDHTDPKQVAQCWHWTNLRPLEAKANMYKRDSITEPQMQLLLCASH
jgi:hypothetical protein